MPAGNYNITIEQGSDLNIPIIMRESDGSPIDLTDYTAHMQIRSAPGGTIYDELTTANSRITIEDFSYLGTTHWRIILHFPNATSSAYSFTNGVYDLEIEDDSSVITRLIEGKVTISPEVTVPIP
jgi:hypothetical protein